ncbi:LOW QUALITY PROTEIN: uncharacterized protein [Typha angustifolia]|uniref:LOW QUALITY PROTEIN: uncharacterized protein n=1 Tax=Typha angustifolia TaxID=59011 RepID=UPI003C3037F6
MESPVEDVEASGDGKAIARRRPRFLCLHGFRASGEIMRTGVVGAWPADVIARLDLVFADGSFPAEGKSSLEGIFPPPYFEWYQRDTDMNYRNIDKCLEYIEELMIKDGPFDGLIGFSQGAMLSAALPGLQATGMALTRVPKVKYVVIMSGGIFLPPEVVEKAYAPKIECPSLHIIGEKDPLREDGEILVKSFVDPFIIRHSEGHIVPRLDDKGLETMLNFLNKIEDYQSKDAIDVKLKEVSCVATA